MIAQPIRNRYILLADVVTITMSAWGAYALRFDWLFSDYRQEFPFFLAAALLLKPVAFFSFGLYRRYWRFASLWDFVAVVLASTSATLLLASAMVVLRLTDQIGGFPRSVVPIDWLLTMTLAGGVRISVRVAAEMGKQVDEPDGMRRVLVAGAGNAGVMVVREMQRNAQLGLLPVGFLDDAPAAQRKTILGVPVLGRLDDLERAAEASRAQEVVIAIPTAPGTVIRRVLESCREASLPSKVIPGFYELLDGKVSVNRLRRVEISDLLRRSQVDMGELSRDYLRGRTALITGAGGSIGAELCRQVARSQPERLVLLGHGENSVFDVSVELRDALPGLDIVPVIADIRDRGRLDAVFARWRPSLVFHAAAHKHVPLMEENPAEAISNNVLGTRHIVDASIAVGVERLVMISSDKAVAPTSIMGASKRIAEHVVRAAARDSGRAFVVVRFGNVLGSRGSVVPLFNRQIERGGPITITHPEMRRFFMTIPEAVHLVLQAGGLGVGAEVFVLDMGEPIPIVRLARDMITLSGFEPEEIPIRFTGLRPGEKLVEALWEDGALVEPTAHASVRRILEHEPLTDVDGMVSDLMRAAGSGSRLLIEHEFARYLPTYVPSSVGDSPIALSDGRGTGLLS